MLGGVAVTLFHVRPRAGLGSTAWSPQGFCPPPLQPGRKTLPGAGHPGLAARSPLGPGDRLVLGAVSPGCRWLLAAPPPSLAPGPQLLCTALVHGRLGEGWALPRPGPSGGASKPCPASGSEGDTWKEAQVAANSGFLRPPPRPCLGGSWRPRALQPEPGAELGLLPSAWSAGAWAAWCADTCPGLHVCGWPGEGSGVLAGPHPPRLLQSPPRKSPAG